MPNIWRGNNVFGQNSGESSIDFRYIITYTIDNFILNCYFRYQGNRIID